MTALDGNHDGPPSATLEPPNFLSNNPQLWPENRRHLFTTLVFDCVLLLGGLYLFSQPAARYGVPPKRLARKKLNPHLSPCLSMIWTIARLYLLDAVLALAKTLLGLGISLILPSMTGWIAQSYDYLDSIDGFFLCLSQVFTVFLVSELDPLLFGKANEKVTPRWRSKMIAIVQYVGWNLVFGITALRTSLLILKQFFAGPFMMTDDMIKVLLFCSSFLLLAPYWVIGGAWGWGNYAITTTGISYRFAWIVQTRDFSSNMRDSWISLFVNILYSRLPTLFVLVMLARVLTPRR